MENIATQLQKHTESITTVIILANGTVPRITVGTDSALSFLSAISLKIPIKNICSILSNISSVLYQNFTGNTAPDILKSGPQFILNNPIALQKQYLKLKNDQNVKTGWRDLPQLVKAAEQRALGMLVDLFDWLDGLEPQPTTEITPLYTKPLDVVTGGHACIGRAVATEAKHPAVDSSACEVQARQSNFETYHH